MKKRLFDIIIIVVLLLLFLTLSYLGLLEKSVKFMFIPFLAFYYIGQYSERKFSKRTGL